MIFGLAIFFFIIGLLNALFWPRARAKGPLADGGLTVCIPARDEEANLQDCLNSVFLQGTCVTQILVYDDHSTDRTAAIGRSMGDERVRVLPPVPLAQGWYGKTFACAQLAQAATTRWMLFLDADTRLQPEACQAMLAEVRHRRLTFLSCWPGFHCATWPEQLLMPMLNFVVFSIFPAPLSLIRREPSLGLAHGACMLVERDAYNRVGGHAAVAQEIFEDTRMAQLWRVKRERGLCLDGQHLVHVRMYASFTEIWNGFSKNFYRAFQHPANFWVFLALHGIVFLLPFFGLDWRAAAAVIALRLVLAIRFGQVWWSVLAHPFAEAIVLGIGLNSWRLSRSKTGVAWKGRHYPLARP